MASLPHVIGLLHRADWTRLSLSAVVRFDCDRDLLHRRMGEGPPTGYRGALTWMGPGRPDRAALLIAPGGRFRLEPQDEDGLVQGNDGQRGWTWWSSSGSDPSPAEVGLDDDRPVPELFCPSDLLGGHVLEVLGPVTVGGRDAIAVAATPRAGDRLHDRVEAAVDAELGILLRREETFGGQLLAVSELTDVTMNPPAAADPARFTAPPGSHRHEGLGESVWQAFSGPDWEKAKNVVGLAAGGVGALIRYAPHLPGHDADRERFEAAMPLPDPDALVPEDGSLPLDDLLYLLYRSGEPYDLGATLHEWHDTTPVIAQVPEETRSAGFGGIGYFLDAVTRGETVTRADARLRISGPDRYRVDYLRRVDRNGPRVVACDGERRWQVYQDRILTGPAAPLQAWVAHLVDTGWLLRCRLSGARDITYRGRRARQFRVTRARGTRGLGPGPLMFFPADAIVDDQTGCLLRLISYVGDAPFGWWELDDISTEPGDPDEFRVHVPPGRHVVEETGNPLTNTVAVMPGVKGTAARAAAETINRTVGAVSAARSFLDDLRGDRRPPRPPP